MRTRVQFVEISRPLDETLALLKSGWSSKEPERAALVTRSEFGFLPRLVEYSFLLAFKSFPLGKARARTLELEWLLHLAATRSIDRALELTRPRTSKVALATSAELPAELLAGLGAPYEPSPHEREASLAKLAELYAFPALALEAYPLEDLAVERSVLSLLE
jgi:hypothetical protein